MLVPIGQHAQRTDGRTVLGRQAATVSLELGGIGADEQQRQVTAATAQLANGIGGMQRALIERQAADVQAEFSLSLRMILGEVG